MAARDPIPDFDLYEELEVSPKASKPTIEAAYRSLLKRHHPDVAGADAAVLERSKRINIAHDWLTDPARRAEYDQARRTAGAGGTTTATAPSGAAAGASPSGPAAGPAGSGAPPGGGQAGAAGGGSAPGSGQAPGGSASPFGPNASTFAAFLTDLGGITTDRALRIAERATAARDAGSGPGTYRGAVLAVAAASPLRQEACVAARAQVASVLAARLAGSSHLATVTEVASDLACAIAVRDLIPKADYEAIRGVWTGRGHSRRPGMPGRDHARGAGWAAGAAPPRPMTAETLADLLADIGTVDLERARRVAIAYRKAGPSGRDGARARAIDAPGRRDAWRAARKDADRAARQRAVRLEGHVSTEVFAWAAADAAGAIALRDAIPPADFDLLFAPWAAGRTRQRDPGSMPLWAWVVVGFVAFALVAIVLALMVPGLGI